MAIPTCLSYTPTSLPATATRHTYLPHLPAILTCHTYLPHLPLYMHKLPVYLSNLAAYLPYLTIVPTYPHSTSLSYLPQLPATPTRHSYLPHLPVYPVRLSTCRLMVSRFTLNASNKCQSSVDNSRTNCPHINTTPIDSKSNTRTRARTTPPGSRQDEPLSATKCLRRR